MPRRYDPRSGHTDYWRPKTDGTGTVTPAVDHIHVYHEELTGSGTTFNLVNTPITETEILTLNLVTRLRRVSSGPGLNEYTILGTTITLGFTKDADDLLVADYERSTGSIHSHVWGEKLSGTGMSFTLPYVPQPGTVRVWAPGVRYRQVSGTPGVNEYSISGAAITLGFAKDADDLLFADYERPTGTLHTHVRAEELSGVGTLFSLLNTPKSGTVRVFSPTVRYRQVGIVPSVNEYSVSGAAVTLGFGKDADDYVAADYLI